MIRARFHVNDSRPVNFPTKHPYWVTYSHVDLTVMVAYAEDEAELLSNWPDATEIEINPQDVVFTSQLMNAGWFGQRAS